ncbi:DUF881 domain-containing protein [Gleimia sp. 6138-11-ORH1]|uniref:DUF881 domain-containing protein n=1 Tax=Gleimia sp. 6138-11-ORH1 TaxID=2973937 RepID=UPI00216A5AC0|nr:DUF881 domain-containing protein [Gleimia sp. 6138-11-ORH1]MCS4484343.1 DUF881 domain-containing protein [Gleimia sp. 6138-11-ORH1]
MKDSEEVADQPVATVVESVATGDLPASQDGDLPASQDSVPYPFRSTAQDSMSLLSALLYDPLNYGYSDVSKEERVTSSYEKTLIFVLAVIIAAVSTLGIRFLVASRAEKEATHQQLLTQVRNMHSRGEATLGQVKAIESEIESLTSLEKVTSEVPPAFLAASHTVALRGPGIKIILANGETDLYDSDVQDQDLRLLLNELWRSKAEAIAINGIRIGPHTPVRTAGSSVLVNFQPVASPYEITAIGSSGELTKGVTTGITGAYFSDLYEDFGITLQVISQDDLLLPATRITKTNLQLIEVVKEEDR